MGGFGGAGEVTALPCGLELSGMIGETVGRGRVPVPALSCSKSRAPHSLRHPLWDKYTQSRLTMGLQTPRLSTPLPPVFTQPYAPTHSCTPVSPVPSHLSLPLPSIPLTLPPLYTYPFHCTLTQNPLPAPPPQFHMPHLSPPQPMPTSWA